MLKSKSPVLASILICALIAPSIATAQVAPEELARRLVGEGIEAAKSRDWMTARERFQRAYEIQPLPLTLFNLAAAQEKTGEFVEADRAYRIFLRETVEGEYPEFRKTAASRRVELRKRTAFVVVRASNIAPDDELWIGEQQIAHAVLGESVPSNPGTLEVRVLRRGKPVASQMVRLESGGSQVVELEVPIAELPPPVVAGLPPPSISPSAAGPQNSLVASAPPPASEESSGVLGSPVFWGVVAAVALAGAGTAAYFVFRPDDPFASNLDRVNIVGR